MGSQFLGKSLSLTTRSNVRYEGTLIAIPEDFSTLTMTSVRMYGTEGRVARENDGVGGMRIVAASNTVYECIVFNAHDIIDIRIAETPTISEPSAFQDPAIVSATVSTKPATPTSSAAPTPSTSSTSGTKIVETAPILQTPQTISSKTSQSKAPEPPVSIEKKEKLLAINRPQKDASLLPTPDKTSEPQQQQQQQQQPRKVRPTIAAPVIEGEFNFEEANAKFDKATVIKEATEQSKKFEKGYDPKNFWDNISRDTTEKQAFVPAMRETQRRADDETFGSAASEQQRMQFRNQHPNQRRGGYGNQNYNNRNHNNNNFQRGGRGYRGNAQYRGYNQNHQNQMQNQNQNQNQNQGQTQAQIHEQPQNSSK